MWYRKLQTSARSLGKDESGANAVEFALVAPVLIILMLGIIQFGMILYTHNNMVQAAREASRILAKEDTTEAEAIAVANTQLGFSGLTFTVTACSPVIGLGGGPPCTAPLDPSTDVSVTITVPLSQASLIDILGLFETGDLEATVTMNKES